LKKFIIIGAIAVFALFKKMFNRGGSSGGSSPGV
jgi:hypothetical protein